MNEGNSIQSLQNSIRRLRFYLVALIVGVVALGLGAMTQEDEGQMTVGPHLVGITAVRGTMPAQTALYRLWSNGRIDLRVVQTDEGRLTNSWEMIQRP